MTATARELPDKGSDPAPPPGWLKIHGLAGIAFIVAAEVLLFSGNLTVGRWFTAIVWTGYVPFVDALVYRSKGTSLLVDNRVEFVLIAIASIACWWLFEWYNAPRFWNSNLEMWWRYHNLEPNLFLRRFGYDWAFATIFPALFETAELLAATVFKGKLKGKPVKIGRSSLILIAIVGLAAAVIPLAVLSVWLVPLVWLSYVFLLDPVNALRRSPSIAGDLSRGDYTRLASLLVSGALCGVLWEFWNYWAISKWTYTVPYFGGVKLFEMPVLGFLGFPPFAIECWAMYVFLRSLLGPGQIGSAWRRDSGDDMWPSAVHSDKTLLNG